MDITTAIGCDVSHVSFSFITSEDVKKLSVKALNNPVTFDPITNYPSSGGLYDPVLGAFDKHESCATCKLDSFSCPGHFGHIELSVPVYHPLLFKQLYNLLRSTCFCCHSLKMKFAKSYRYMARLHLARAGLLFESIELGSADVREMDLGEALGTEEANIASTAGLDDGNIKSLIDHFCNEAFKKHGLNPRKVKYQKPSTMTHDYIRNLIKEILSVACNTKMCENCGAKSPTLRKESNSKIFMNPLSGRDKARMEAKGLLEKNVYGEPGINEEEEMDIDEQLEDEAAKKSKSIFMTPMEVRQHMKLMWEKEIAFMDHLFGSIMYGQGNKRKSTFEIFFLDVIPVAPTKFRPISKMGDKQFDHPQNTFLVEIIKYNNSIVELSRLKRDSKEKPQQDAEQQQQNGRNPFAGMINSWVSLQESVNNLHDSTKNPKSKMMPSGIKQIMEKKEGLFRKHMMGKRVNYAARSVISPDPMIETSEIGIPLVFAKKLTFPEPVTQYNINEMRQAVINGPETYPGALSVQNEDGSLISLQHCSEERRLALANQLTTPSNNVSANENTPYLNKKVHRHLRNGDMLLLNRQPTLHKPSIMGHVARILPGEKTIRMHYANCNTYNADFDGDEMNVHFPQNPIAQAEARLIMNTNNQYLVPTSGEPLRGLIQDHVVTGVLMTSRDTFLTREDYTQLVFGALPQNGKRIVTVTPAIMKPVPLWTGKQVISTIMKNLTDGYKPLNMESTSQTPSKSWSVMQKVNTEEGTVLFLDGELMTGVLDKKQFGAKAYGLVHSCFEVYGGDIAGKLLTTLGRLFTRYTQFIGFSCRMDDLVVLPEADVVRRAKIADALQQGRQILMEFAFPDQKSIVETAIEKKLKATIANPSASDQDIARAKKTLEAIEDQRLFKTLEDTIRSDEKLAALDNKMKSKTGSVTTGIVKDTIPNGLLKPFPDNGMQLMTISGAKGSNVNVTQISCMLGQQELEGRRVPVMVSGKTLPSFRAYDLGPRAGGYITGRFLTGIKPQEYYFHCMAGREGLVDTAVKTARSGYLQRCLIKHMEGLKVNYDSTVRDSADGSVYQFHYGEDSLDVTKSSYLKKFKFNAQNYEAFLDKYNPHAAVKALECQKAIKHAKKAHKKPEKYEPTLAKFNPGRHLGAVSEKFYADLQDYITKDPDNIFGENSRPSEETFEALMQLKYINSLIEPGEAVGVLAAQSVGEPSTQMTLNSVEWNTELLINGNGQLERVKIGEYIDNEMKVNTKIENHPNDTKLAWTKEKEMYILSCDKYGKVSWKLIEAVTRHPPINEDGSNTLLKVTTESGRSVIATKAKSFLKRVNNEIVAARGDELKVGDYLPVSKILPVSTEDELWNTASYVSQVERVCFSQLEIQETSTLVPIVDTTNTKRREIPELLPLDGDFGYLMGVFFLNGSCSDSQIILPESNQKLLKCVQSLSARYGIKYEVDSNSLRINCNLMAQIISKACGTSALSKRIPAEYLNANKVFLSNMVNAFCYSPEFVSVTSMNKGLLEDMQQVLVKLGVITQIVSDSDGLRYTLSHASENLLEIVPDVVLKQGTVALHRSQIEQMLTSGVCNEDQDILRRTIEEDIIYDKVISIEEVISEHPYVYDLTVQDTRNFNIYNSLCIRDTFHFAGHGAKNVTLGIPRLREIIMTASTKPKTPQMSVPFKPHVEKKRAEEICRNISKLTLDMLIEDAQVTEKFVTLSHGRYRSYRLRLKFCKRSEYEAEFGLKTEGLQRVLEKQFIKKLVAAIQKDLVNSKKNQDAEEDQIGKGQDVTRFQESLEMSADSGEGQPKKVSKGAKSVLSDDEGDEMELDASSANRAQKKKQHSSYDGPDDEDKEIIKNQGNSDDEDIPMDSNIAANVDEIIGDNRYVCDYVFDQKKGRYCEFELHFPSNTKKILMVSHIEKVASSCVINEVPGINKCFVIENKETGELIMTSDGVNITGMYAFDEEFDLTRIESNDVAAILKCYGVEAARKTIIREVSSVFAVYGIDVDPRHLTVIADYMTFEGGYRPFNRMGMESNVSPFAKMTFETTFHFLTDATMRGDSDTLTNPSARIVVGRVVEGGTGSFEIVQPLLQHA